MHPLISLLALASSRLSVKFGRKPKLSYADSGGVKKISNHAKTPRRKDEGMNMTGKRWWTASLRCLRKSSLVRLLQTVPELPETLASWREIPAEPEAVLRRLR